jgi:hypothetical protein
MLYSSDEGSKIGLYSKGNIAASLGPKKSKRSKSKGVTARESSS